MSTQLLLPVSSETDISLYDGRMIVQNGWYVLRSILPAGKTGKVLTWHLRPHAIENWVREPNIGFSQVGYMPNQPKVAVIELDRNYPETPQVSLYRISADGKSELAYSAKVRSWGKYFKYNYVKFDFSIVT